MPESLGGSARAMCRFYADTVHPPGACLVQKADLEWDSPGGGGGGPAAAQLAPLPAGSRRLTQQIILRRAAAQWCVRPKSLF